MTNQLTPQELRNLANKIESDKAAKIDAARFDEMLKKANTLVNRCFLYSKGGTSFDVFRVLGVKETGWLGCSRGSWVEITCDTIMEYRGPLDVSENMKLFSAHCIKRNHIIDEIDLPDGKRRARIGTVVKSIAQSIGYCSPSGDIINFGRKEGGVFDDANAAMDSWMSRNREISTEMYEELKDICEYNTRKTQEFARKWAGELNY